MSQASIARIQALLDGGRDEDAASLAQELASLGDPDALYLLASWKLLGQNGPRDPVAAYRCLQRAEELGHVPAAGLRAFLTANGTGCSEDFEEALRLMARLARDHPYAARQLDLIAAMPDPQTAGAAPRQTLSADPRVELVRKWFTAAECAYLMSAAEPRLAPATTVNPLTHQRVLSRERTAHDTVFDPTQEDLVIRAVNRRLAAVTGSPVGCGEPLHVLRYQRDQEYKPHLDAMIKPANQRVMTALIYLNDDYGGGETVFPRLGLSVRGTTGDVLLFANSGPDGGPDPRMIHAGTPVSSGTKWLASRWIRERPFDGLSLFDDGPL